MSNLQKKKILVRFIFILPCDAPQLVLVAQAVHDEAGVPRPLHLTLMGQAGLGVGGGDGAAGVGRSATGHHVTYEDKPNDDLEHDKNAQTCEVNVKNIFTEGGSLQEIYCALEKRNLCVACLENKVWSGENCTRRITEG